MCSGASPAAQRGQPWAVGRQRQRLVLGGRLCHQLRQPDGFEQARADAAGKGGAVAGQHRRPRPQRVARRAVGVVVQRVKLRNRSAHCNRAKCTGGAANGARWCLASASSCSVSKVCGASAGISR